MHWHYRTTVLALCLLAFFVTYFARMAISPVVPFIATDFNISNTQVGLALSGMWLAYGLVQYPSGIFGDKFGEKQIILTAVGGTTIASVLLAFSPFYFVFVIFAIILGLFAGLHYAVAVTLLSRLYDETGRAIGVHSIGGPLAGLIAPVVVAWVAVQFNWRISMAITVIVGIPIFILFVVLVNPIDPQRPNQSMRSRIKIDVFIDLLTRPSVKFTIGIATVGTFTVQGLLTFLPTFLIEYHEYSAPLAGTMFATFFLVRTGGQILLGEFSDRYGRDAILGTALIVGAVGLLIMVVKSNLVTVGVAIIFSGVGSSFFAVVDPRFLDQFSAPEQNAGFGMVRTVYTVIGALGSFGVGVFSDIFGWELSFICLSALLSVATIGLFVNWIFNLGF